MLPGRTLLMITAIAGVAFAGQAFAGANANAVLSLDLIPGGGAGNQRDDGVASGTVSGRGTTIAVEVFATGVQTSVVGIILKFDFDASLLSFIKAENSGFPLSLPEGSIGVNLAAQNPVTLASSGFLARAEFTTVSNVTGRQFSIGIESVTLAESPTSSDELRTSGEVTFNSAPSADFDGDNHVGFSDFLVFASVFGSRQGDGRYNAAQDLNTDGSIDFADFLIFAQSFGGPPPSTAGGDGTITAAIPDRNLRAGIEEGLGKATGAPIIQAEMATLTRLEASSESISDLTGLEAAVNLTRLDLRDNDISNVTPLSGLTRLEFLDLSENSISNVVPLTGLTHLDTLGLGYNSFPSTSALVSALANLTNLRVLGIAGNRISNVSALSDLTRLEFLDLSDNGISNVSALSYLINLTGLRLSDNSISNISALSGLTRLEGVDLDNNGISDVTTLSNLTNLTVLWLAGNDISNISALSRLTRVEFLDLDNNSIADVSVLSNLTNVEWLWLAGNGVSNLAALSRLARLEWLDIANNRVTDLAPLVANTGMDSGDLLDVRNNPLNATSINVHVPALQRRGVDVAFSASKIAVKEKKRRMFPAAIERYMGDLPEAAGARPGR